MQIRVGHKLIFFGREQRERKESGSEESGCHTRICLKGLFASKVIAKVAPDQTKYACCLLAPFWSFTGKSPLLPTAVRMVCHATEVDCCRCATLSLNCGMYPYSCNSPRGATSHSCPPEEPLAPTLPPFRPFLVRRWNIEPYVACTSLDCSVAHGISALKSCGTSFSIPDPQHASLAVEVQPSLPSLTLEGLHRIDNIVTI